MDLIIGKKEHVYENLITFQERQARMVFIKKIKTKDLIKLNSKVYFCEPYASYQRGLNEHVNGIIRRFWKKGTDFHNYHMMML